MLCLLQLGLPLLLPEVLLLWQQETVMVPWAAPSLSLLETHQPTLVVGLRSQEEHLH